MKAQHEQQKCQDSADQPDAPSAICRRRIDAAAVGRRHDAIRIAAEAVHPLRQPAEISDEHGRPRIIGGYRSGNMTHDRQSACFGHKQCPAIAHWNGELKGTNRPSRPVGELMHDDVEALAAPDAFRQRDGQ